jgi:hypothetical protein
LWIDRFDSRINDLVGPVGQAPLFGVLSLGRHKLGGLLMQTATRDAVEELDDANTASSPVKSLSVIFFCVILSGAAVVPYFFMGQPDEEQGQTRWSLRMPDTHDIFLHWDQMKSFYTGLRAGERYPRWEVETNRGFGAPTTCFYPPAIYYVTSSFYYLARDWLLSLLWTHLAIMVASAAAIYLYARRSLSRPAAIVAMACYTVLPYHLIDQYQRGALAELLGFVWMPLILLFIEQLWDPAGGPSGLARSAQTIGPLDAAGTLGAGDEAGGSLTQVDWRRLLGRRLAAVAGLGLAYGAFIWSHPPTAFQFSMALAIFVPLLALARKKWIGIALAGVGIALGLALASAYLYPAYMEKNLIHNEFIGENWPYRESYVFLHTEYMDEHRPFFNLINMTWTVNIAIVVVCVAIVLILMYAKRQKPVWPRWQVGLWAAIGLFAGFMMTVFSDPIGRRIPMIDIGVFSWRMLAITTLAAALMAGAVAEMGIQAFRMRARGAGSVAWGTVGLLVASAAVFTVVAVLAPVWNGVLFVPEEEHLNPTMLPRTAPHDPEDLPEAEPVELDQDAGTVHVERWYPQHREITASLTDSDTLLVRTFNYPGWTATVDGNPSVIQTGEELGDIHIDLDQGHHKVVLDFLDTPIRRRGSLVSLASMALVSLLLIGAAVIAIASAASSR